MNFRGDLHSLKHTKSVNVPLFRNTEGIAKRLIVY